MSSQAISISNLSKRYRLGASPAAAYRTLRETITGAVTAPVRALRRSAAPQAPAAKTLWALRDVSFSVPKGEVVGIIGRNGAGKSTLLKVLSRITQPTEGRVEVRGRMSSLLEVGTGFHPELTGRENISLNGAIMGMTRREIEQKFDEIVAFAGVEEFIDTPVKRYSSGMYLRLAFAVAAHLEPEILVVDEVLAVGDASFQKKCMGKMQDVAGQGRTVLFVSHNMPAVTRLCTRAVLLDKGRLVQDGPAPEVTAAYLSGGAASGATRDWSVEEAPGTDELQLLSVSLHEADGSPVAVARIDQPLQLQLKYHVSTPGLRFRCVALFNTQGVMAFASMEPTEQERSRSGGYCSTLEIPANLLAEGEYVVGISIFTSRGAKHRYVQVLDAIGFQVYDPMTGQSARGDYAEPFSGVMRPLLPWSLAFEG